MTVAHRCHIRPDLTRACGSFGPGVMTGAGAAHGGSGQQPVLVRSGEVDDFALHVSMLKFFLQFLESSF